eukprot:TRINITY_DN63342_c0_g1_i1.p1 TRINITY_DN63342_c0_g1~~TRINITY_DN63342_c0_g1_i1.p1  ORF type:complete len:588 (-),score=132.42 TRINITY_DN63342_c0_g1_i1:232-1995(-)
MADAEAPQTPAEDNNVLTVEPEKPVEIDGAAKEKAAPTEAAPTEDMTVPMAQKRSTMHSQSQGEPGAVRARKSKLEFTEDNTAKQVGTALADDAEERPAGTLLRERLLAEFIGTFFLVMSVGIAVAGKGPLAPIGIGVILSIMIYCFGSVSGACLNPAVTLAVLCAGRGKLSPKDGILYMVVQFLGGIFGALFAWAATNDTFHFDVSPFGGPGSSVFLELFYTAALCSTVLATGTSFDCPNHYFGFAIGLSVTSAAYAISGFDMGSLNPAVTVGINLANLFNTKKPVRGTAAGWLLFLIVPFLGGVLAACIFRVVRKREMAYAAQPDAEVPPTGLVEKLVAEFVGTFYLVLTVVMAVMSQTPFAAVSIGLMLGIQIYSYGSVSGGLFNPAVTLAVLLSGRAKICVKDAVLYMCSQFFGALVAGFVGFACAGPIGSSPGAFAFDWAYLGAKGSPGTSFVCEVFFTAALCIAVLKTGTSYDAPNEYFGFAIGGTVLASAIICGGFDQGSFNPAVTFGIQISQYAFNNGTFPQPSIGALFFFLLVPFLGSFVAAGVFYGTRNQELRDYNNTIADLHKEGKKRMSRISEKE